MGTCASVNASQVHPLPEGPGIILDTAVFTRPSQTGTSSVRTKRLELKDATPQNLKEVFKLDFYPKVVTDKKTHLTRFHKGPPTKPFSKLQVNAEYEVGGGEDEEDGEEEDLYKLKTEGVSMKTGDVQRAVICCQAVYLSDLPDTDAIRQFFKEERDLHNFERVSVSRFGPVRYLLAETRDKEEVFVAFKGTSDFNDVMADLKFWPEAAGQSGDNHCSGVIGTYHTGFMDLAFRIPARRILKKYSKRRIVVCGHSLGGAVAHIVAINMMMHLRSNDQPVDNVKSIAFGAPFFGNGGAQQFVEEYNLSPHLLTIVNEKDPVPYILRLAETVHCSGLTALKKFEDFSAVLVDILGLLKTSGILGVGATLVKSALSSMPDKLVKCKSMLKDWADSARDLNSIYVPIGWYLCISCSTPKAGGGGHWNRSLLDHIGAVQYARPDIRDWKAEDFQCHRMSNYRTTFFQIARGTTYRSDDENSRSSDVTMTDPIFPASIKKLKVHVLTVKDDTDDSRSTIAKTSSSSSIAKTCQIEIKGDNLDFLERNVPISGLPVPDGKIAVLHISRKLVALQCDIRTDSLSAAEATIRTQFEEKKAPKVNLKDIKEVPKLPYKEGLLREVVKGVAGTIAPPKGEKGESFFGAVARGAASGALSGALSGAWNWWVKNKSK